MGLSLPHSPRAGSMGFHLWRKCQVLGGGGLLGGQRGHWRVRAGGSAQSLTWRGGGRVRQEDERQGRERSYHSPLYRKLVSK